jgi:Transposase, Mutator family
MSGLPGRAQRRGHPGSPPFIQTGWRWSIRGHPFTCPAYDKGGSTRRVDGLVKTLGIEGNSKSQVSEMAKSLDEAVAAFRSRPMDGAPYTYVWLDALTMRVREGGRIAQPSAVIATAVNADGHSTPFHTGTTSLRTCARLLPSVTVDGSYDSAPGRSIRPLHDPSDLRGCARPRPTGRAAVRFVAAPAGCVTSSASRPSCSASTGSTTPRGSSSGCGRSSCSSSAGPTSAGA